MFAKHDKISINSAITIGLDNCVCVKHEGILYLGLYDAHKVTLFTLESNRAKQLANDIVLTNPSDLITKISLTILHNRIILVVACIQSLHVYDLGNAGKLVKSHNFETVSDADVTIVAIKAIGSKTLVVASKLQLIFWETSFNGSELVIHNESIVSADLDSDSMFVNHLVVVARLEFVVTDNVNTIATWKFDDKSCTATKTSSITTHPNTRINCFAIYKKHYLLGTMCGQVQVINNATGAMMIEIQAHVKCVTSMDICTKTGLLVTGSEDSFVQVFKLITNGNQLQVEHLYQTFLVNEIICNVHFLSSDAKSFMALTYESSHIQVFKWKA